MRENLQASQAGEPLPKPYMLYGEREAAPVPGTKALKDLEYFMSLYPGRMKRLQGYVQKTCDAMDYEKSPIYDEYPDRVMIEQMSGSICRQIREDYVTGTGNGSGPEGPSNTEDRMSADIMALDAAAPSSIWHSGTEVEEVEIYEAAPVHTQQISDPEPAGPRPPQQQPPPWGPPPGPRPPQPPSPPWGPPPGPRPPQPPSPPWGPPPGPRPPQPPLPPWGPPPGPRPPQPPLPPWGPPPGPRPPQPPRPAQPPSGNWLNDVIRVLLLNELHRRRCGAGIC